MTTIVQPPFEVVAWFTQNLPQCAEPLEVQGFIHQNIERVLMMYEVGAPYQGGIGAYELWLQDRFSSIQPCLTTIQPASIIIPETQEAAKKGIDPKLIIIAVIAFILLSRS